MTTRVERQTVDLSAYADLVVIILGMRVNRMTGIKTLLGFGPKISSSAEARPDGLLAHEAFLFSVFPMHAGIRQYWRDEESLLKWTRSDPHRQWWQNFLRDSGGNRFLARDILPAGRHGGDLRRCPQADRAYALCAAHTGARPNVRRRYARWESIRGRAGVVGTGTVWGKRAQKS